MKTEYTFYFDQLKLNVAYNLGHRSLFKYYKQSFGHRNLELKKKSNLSVKDKYKAIAYGQSYSGLHETFLFEILIYRLI